MAALTQSDTEAIDTVENSSPVDGDSTLNPAFSFRSDEDNDSDNVTPLPSDDVDRDLKKARDRALRRDILPSLSMADYFKENIKNEQMHIFIPVLTKIFDKYNGETIDDIKARIIDYECFSITIGYLNKLIKLIKKLENMYSNTIKQQQRTKHQSNSATASLGGSIGIVDDSKTSETDQSPIANSVENDLSDIEDNINNSNNNIANNINNNKKNSKHNTRRTGSGLESIDKRSEEYKEATQGNQYIKPGDRIYLTRLEGSAGHKKECEKLIKKYLKSMGLGGIIGNSLFELMYSYKVYEPLHLRSKLTTEEFDEMYNEAIDSPNISLVGRQSKYLEGTRYGWTKKEIDDSFKNKKRKNTRSNRKRTGTNGSIISVGSPRHAGSGDIGASVGSPRNARSRSRSKGGQNVSRGSTPRGSTPRGSTPRGSTPRSNKNNSMTPRKKAKTPKGGNKKGSNNNNNNNNKNEYYTESENPVDQLRVYFETEAKLGHVFCQVISDVLVTKHGITGIESFKKKCKNDKKRQQMILEAKTIHTPGGIANFRDFEKFVKKLRY